MIKLETIKLGLGLVVGAGVDGIVTNAIKMVKPTNVKGIKRVSIAVGGFALSMMVADKVVEYVNDLWDSTAETFKEIFKKKESEEESIEEEV